MATTPDYTCDRCFHKIGLFITHVRLDMEMVMGGKAETRRYCADCCADPSMAVLFNDVIQQPVYRMQITKVWS
jgi:hypothetical protein